MLVSVSESFLYRCIAKENFLMQTSGTFMTMNLVNVKADLDSFKLREVLIPPGTCHCRALTFHSS